MKIELNVGLNINGVELLNLTDVLRQVIRHWHELSDLSAKVEQSNTERTAVIVFNVPPPCKVGKAEQLINDVAKLLCQEAIACKIGNVGAVIGPKAAEWGDFNPDFWIDPK